MDTTRYMEIGGHKLLKPEYFKTLPSHRALAYYRKNVIDIPGKYSSWEFDGWVDNPDEMEIEDNTNEHHDNIKRQLLEYHNKIKTILEQKDHVE